MENYRKWLDARCTQTEYEVDGIIYYATIYDPKIHGDRCSKCDLFLIKGAGWYPCFRVWCTAGMRQDKHDVIWIQRKGDK